MPYQQHNSYLANKSTPHRKTTQHTKHDTHLKLQPWSNSHCHELLEQQLARIWHENLDNAAGLASWAVKLILLQVCCSDHATLLTDVDTVCI